MALNWENALVQGVGRVDRELLDAGALVGHLVPEGSMFAFLAAHRQDVFADGGLGICSRRGGEGRRSRRRGWPRFWCCRPCMISPTGRPLRRPGVTCGG